MLRPLEVGIATHSLLLYKYSKSVHEMLRTVEQLELCIHSLSPQAVHFQRYRNHFRHPPQYIKHLKFKSQEILQKSYKNRDTNGNIDTIS